MRPTARSDRPTVTATPRPSGDVHKWLDLALLVLSGAAILTVVMWLQGALAG